MKRIKNEWHIICTRIEVAIMVHIIRVHHSATRARIIDSSDCHGMIEPIQLHAKVFTNAAEKRKTHT